MAVPHELRSKSLSIFRAAVNGLLPEKLISSHVRVRQGKVYVAGRSLDLEGNIHVVGFGKAVVGMAESLLRLLGDHLVAGVLSVPVGSGARFLNTEEGSKLGKFTILEGAKNNLPDEASQEAANHILNYVLSLKPSDILFVLISGGGSALFPVPVPSITLQQKRDIVEALMRCGATIQEINVVRKRLSLVKGGGLVQLSPTKKIVSLIISDIVGDPLDLIASGPTVLDSTGPDEALRVVENHFLQLKAGPDVMSALKSERPPSHPEMFETVINVVVGSNEIGLQHASQKAEDLGLVPYLLTSSLTGDAGEVGVALAKLASLVNDAYYTDKLPYKTLEPMFKVLNISPEIAELLLIKLRHARFHHRNFCLVLGGETTVVVRGEGLGGRCQHLALSAAIEMESRPVPGSLLLSAGTDGIDGPTDAAGAVVYPGLVKRAARHDLDARFYLHRNDSYNFFLRLAGGENLVMTGHTGTNCMDIVLLLFDWGAATGDGMLRPGGGV